MGNLVFRRGNEDWRKTVSSLAYPRSPQGHGVFGRGFYYTGSTDEMAFAADYSL
jgi:hypothetical protein